jgi:hypothetical protein
LVVGDDQHTKIWAKGMRNSAATISGYVSGVGEESGCGEALREPERLLLAGVGAATSSFPPSVDFAAERDLRPRAGVAWGP